MTKIETVTYQCDKCRCQYETEEEAYNCEKVHVDVVGVTKMFYNKQCKYPYGANLKLSDGEVFYFKKN